MPHLRITAFAGLSVERDGQPLGPFPTHKTAALLAYLLTFRTRSHPRSVLAGLLWPEVPEVRARHNLSDALWRLLTGTSATVNDKINATVSYGQGDPAIAWSDAEEGLAVWEDGRAGGSVYRIYGRPLFAEAGPGHRTFLPLIVQH